MNKILSGIRSVHGVWGIIVIDKRRALTYQMLPATYTADAVKTIAIPILSLAQSTEKDIVVDLFFKNGKARIYNHGDAAVLILGHKELSLDSLASICRSAVPTISRRFSRGDLGDQPVAGIEPGNVSFDFLLKAINILASNAQKKIGAYLVTKHLRNAKDALMDRYEFLTSISVDNNGVARLLKGYPPYSGDDLLEAFAHWANLFVSNCATSSNKLNPADILELTMEIKDKLEISGFYQLYADIGV
jgi:predicted regulator of Ras-like GTPase activity (Roadblock/LC7/MglB family)